MLAHCRTEKNILVDRGDGQSNDISLKGGAKPIFFFCKWKVNIHIIISLDVFDFFLTLC